MTGWETAVAALGGLTVGASLAGWLWYVTSRRWVRERASLETRIRRDVIPVLERRADVLGIPPSERGKDEDGPVQLAASLARAIRAEEESGQLPFGDTLEAQRAELDAELRRQEA